ncbi:MAG: hypothetical protein EPO21_13760 [Chloroflexota bacterium]|nr:MAG: hypothetical protein EPO21_13760 [Chloroflexota bacterium]
MEFEPNCATTAMGIMPHTNLDQALDLALGLDVAFWPQLPNTSFLEDMYAQASEHFPGILVDSQHHIITFDTGRFAEELPAYSEISGEPQTYALAPEHSPAYHRFLSRDLSRYRSIRGQIIGPISYGFRVVDQNRRPVIYDDDVRPLFFDFLQNKLNHQYRQLREKNPHAFVWLDEPGLGWIFSAMSGYVDTVAREDYRAFLAGCEGPRALHLCADINLPFLLSLGLDIVSFDAFQIGQLPREYAAAAARFLKEGGIISWGIVPTDSSNLGEATLDSLQERLRFGWQRIAEEGVPLEQIARQSMLAPARCCLKNIGRVGAAGEEGAVISAPSDGTSIEEKLVETAFGLVSDLSHRLRAEFRL